MTSKRSFDTSIPPKLKVCPALGLELGDVAVFIWRAGPSGVRAMRLVPFVLAFAMSPDEAIAMTHASTAFARSARVRTV
jgi:hypothetical protein